MQENILFYHSECGTTMILTGSCIRPPRRRNAGHDGHDPQKILYQWIGWRNKFHRKSPYIHGKIHGFQWRFSRKPIHWYTMFLSISRYLKFHLQTDNMKLVACQTILENSIDSGDQISLVQPKSIRMVNTSIEWMFSKWWITTKHGQPSVGQKFVVSNFDPSPPGSGIVRASQPLYSSVFLGGYTIIKAPSPSHRHK